MGDVIDYPYTILTYPYPYPYTYTYAPTGLNFAEAWLLNLLAFL